MTDPLRAELESSLGPAYSLVRELGGGGMARVFLARDRNLGRDVVVKVLSPELAEQLLVERFSREIRVAATLQDPHIVPVLIAGQTAGGLPYYTMPFIRGESLRARLTRGDPLPWTEGLAIIRDVAKALAHAHGEKVWHRDIKPENVLLSSGSAVVTDFGIAKALDASKKTAAASTLTVAGAALGTPAYMAPEQAVADPAADQRADLYSWGVLAYEVLTGRHPFAHRASAQAVVAAHLTEKPAPLEQALPELPESVVRIIMRCLEKDPANRPRDAAEVGAALEPGGGWEPAGRRWRVTEGEFRLSEEVCRRLDRATLEPQLIGDTLTYQENDAPADVLALCLHGMGSDAGDFTELLQAAPFHVVAPTLYGFEPKRERRVPIAIEAQLELLRELLRDTVSRLGPSRVVLVGFSSGGDLALRLLATTPPDPSRVDACLALGPNLSLATCFASRIFARLQGGDPASLLADLRRIGSDTDDLDEWLNAMTYILRGVQKFRGNVAPVARFAAGVIEPFEVGDDAFATWFRAASRQVQALRCVFETSPDSVALVEALRLRNLDEGTLGPRYRPDAIVLEAPADHFALLDPARIERHVGALLTQLGKAA